MATEQIKTRLDCLISLYNNALETQVAIEMGLDTKQRMSISMASDPNYAKLQESIAKDKLALESQTKGVSIIKEYLEEEKKNQIQQSEPTGEIRPQVRGRQSRGI
jgi:hypothetical protein